jgi:hypothetical protein
MARLTMLQFVVDIDRINVKIQGPLNVDRSQKIGRKFSPSPIFTI